MHSGLRHDMLLMLRHTAEPASEASCCNLLIVFCSFSLDGQIFGDILSVFIPQSSELAYSGEMENTWIAGWGRERKSSIWFQMCDWVGWDGHEEALAVTDTIYLTWRVPVVIVAMFQHCTGTMCLGDQRFTQMHLSHSELVCVIPA